MKFNSPKFKSKIRRVLLLTAGCVIAKLIASKDFLDLMNLKNEFILMEIGKMNLRGRSVPVILYSVNKE